MQLYAGTARQFVQDTVQNRIAEKLVDTYTRRLGTSPGPGEVNAWRNSLRAFCNILTYVQFFDQGIVLEYQLPLTSKRLDCLVAGKSFGGKPNAVIVELKQWEQATESSIDECVVTFVGGRQRDVLHPSRQVGSYLEYLEDCHTAFNEGGVRLSACSYLHNFQRDPSSVMYAPAFQELLQHYPLFAGDEADELSEFLTERVGRPDDLETFSTVLQSKYRPSKKLLEHVHAVIKREPTYVLLDEQRVVFNAVLAAARNAFHDKQKVAILVKGGPGTGKSVIALNLVAELSALGYNAQHATGSRAFTENIRKVVGKRAGAQFDYFRRYASAEYNDVDVLILDEAHRIRPISDTMFRRLSRPGMRQIDELILAAKVSVFFIDDLQVVRPGEVGASELIREAAQQHGAKLVEFELESQFRCNGSDAFINWIDSSLDIRPAPNLLWQPDDGFDFQIFDRPQDLVAVIRSKSEQGHSARLTAGFCWRWSDPTPEGRLVDDVQLDGFAMPWNARPNSGRLAPGIPKADYWASDPNGINQVGCVYTAQGFEFDYCGVIFGRDLVYDPVAATWVARKQYSADSMVRKADDREFLRLVKHTYRVLLTRALKGCYVYFQDENTRAYFQSRILNGRQ